MCGHVWLAHARSEPRRCANPQCRSMRWDATKYPDVKPPDPQGPNPGTRTVVVVADKNRYFVKFPPPAARANKSGGSHALIA